jgi:hypothetical protein
MKIPSGFKVTQLTMDATVTPIKGPVPDTNWEQTLSNGKVAKWVQDKETGNWSVTNCHLKEIPKKEHFYEEEDWITSDNDYTEEVWVDNDDETKVIVPKNTDGIYFVQGPSEIYGKFSTTSQHIQSLNEMIDYNNFKTYKFDFEYEDSEHGNIKLLGILLTSEYLTNGGTEGSFCCDKVIKQK